MSAVVKDNSFIQEQKIRYSRRVPRNQSISPSSSEDPTPQISPLLQSARCKPSISSIFLSTFSTSNNSNGITSNNVKDDSKKKNLSSSSSSSTFKGFGCSSISSHQVSAPTVIRKSADWQAKNVRKKKQRKKQQQTNPTPVVVVPDVWCAPGIAFSSADTDASVDCVVSRRPVHQSSRGRNYNGGNGGGGDRVSNNNHRERPCVSRRTANLQHTSSILDSPSDLETYYNESEVFGARHHRHYRHDYPGGISEILMFQNSLLLGGRSSGHDRYRDLRLNVDNMSYEELLDLGESIGYVSTGLREDEITRCLKKAKLSILDALQSHFLTDMNWKCSICQEEYEADDELGKLDCGHNYHICCIKQWLLQKNACPVCKVAVTAQY